MGGSGEIMTGRGWWQQNHGWSSWVIVGGDDKIMADCRLLWVVARFSKFLTSQLADSMDLLIPSTFASL